MHPVQEENIKHGFVNQNNLTAINLIKWDIPSVLNTNICGGLAAKLDELEVLFCQNSVDVACITETWCRPMMVTDASLTLQGYSFIRQDRDDGRQHGGIICYI